MGCPPPLVFHAADHPDRDSDDDHEPSETVDEEADRRLAAGEIPKVTQKRVGSSDLFKVGGSISGRDCQRLLREKAVQGRMVELASEHRKDKKEDSGKAKLKQLWVRAGSLLTNLKAGADIKKMNTPELFALLTIKGVEVPKSKGDRRDAVIALLGGANNGANKAASFSPKLDDLLTWHRVAMDAAPAAPLLLMATEVSPPLALTGLEAIRA